jgi:hypothetical protein
LRCLELAVPGQWKAVEFRRSIETRELHLFSQWTDWFNNPPALMLGIIQPAVLMLLLVL